MARPGFTCDEIATILKIHRNSATDAVNPQMRKLCKLFLANPVKFMEWFHSFLSEVSEEIEQERMDSELELRENMSRGTANRIRTRTAASA
jgi:hypothetical protein